MTFAPYLESFGCKMGNQVFEEKACYTLFAELLAHPKAQDISHLFQKYDLNALHEMVKSRRTLVPRLKQLARMVLSSFASCGIKGKLIDYCLYQRMD